MHDKNIELLTKTLQDKYEKENKAEAKKALDSNLELERKHEETLTDLKEMFETQKKAGAKKALDLKVELERTHEKNLAGLKERFETEKKAEAKKASDLGVELKRKGDEVQKHLDAIAKMSTECDVHRKSEVNPAIKSCQVTSCHIMSHPCHCLHLVTAMPPSARGPQHAAYALRPVRQMKSAL